MVKKLNNVWTYLVLIFAIVLLGDYIGFYSIIPISGLQESGTLDPLYVQSKDVTGWGSAASYGYVYADPGGGGDVGRGITEDFNQLRWFYKLEPVSASQLKYTLIGIDMVLFAESVAPTQGCWMWSDLLNPSAFPSVQAGYYFNRVMNMATNVDGNTIESYSFLTDTPTEFDENKAFDFQMKQNSDFGWRKVKHLESSEMISPGAVRVGLTWKPTAGIQNGVIPTVEEIDENYASYSAIGSSVTCGDVYAFKKEYTINYDPNNPTDIYLAVVFDEDLEKTAISKLSHLSHASILKNPEVDLSELYYAHFGPCGDNIPVRFDQVISLPRAVGDSAAGSGFVSHLSYIYKGKVYHNVRDIAGVQGGGHNPAKVFCPDDVDKTGISYCAIRTVDGVDLIYGVQEHYAPGTTALTHFSTKYYAKSDESLTGIIDNVDPRYSPADVDVTNVPVVADFESIQYVVAEIEGKEPNDIWYYEGERTVGSTELPVKSLTNEDSIYEGITVGDTTYISQITGGPNRPAVSFFTETDNYKEFKEMYQGTTCGFEAEEVTTVDEQPQDDDKQPWNEWNQDDPIDETSPEQDLSIWFWVLGIVAAIGVVLILIKK